MFTVASLPSQEGKVFIVTGGNAGIGFITCLNLAAKGGKVYLGARSEEKAMRAIQKIKDTHPEAVLIPLVMDNSRLATIVAAAKTFTAQEATLNGLILNAGVMAVPFSTTPDGYEIQWQVNYLAHWLLAHHLTPTLLSTSLSQGKGASRVVCVSSEGHQKSSFSVDKIIYGNDALEKFGPFGRYGVSKLGNVLHSVSLNNAYGPESPSAKAGKGEIWTASLHPGFIDTELNEKNRDNAPWYLSWLYYVLKWVKVIRPVQEGCVSSIFVGASDYFLPEMSGRYFDEYAGLKEANAASKDENEVKRLEEWTREQMANDGFL
ncbi:NAD(P)-binding Rossmann-fold containing protein [Glarea lozoyensis ATCC 20868]|uniref:NAD(P)-binding Rossmann-fold containing protein n=1 Tax=Glarea lozoyensis (strain ATCC 20868 / MF5171) TaxID=1116229 RepID=S3D088_GLAL2|nr:NAD(P)-binding Rossmann-fold containing protein [Glarea lozoyensis ATCC 20868]EPE25476.1 NAD(P)-binding Rossmann-fold containing protein [Glarea lozoyensis ATCC 20868]